MPELPEVEVLVRHLAPLLRGKTIERVHVHREKSIRPDSARRFKSRLQGCQFISVTRRAKFLVFQLRPRKQTDTIQLLGHLGMTGRMYLQPPTVALPKHAAISFDLGKHSFVFEDTRYFGRMTTDLMPLQQLGPEPLSDEFTPAGFHRALRGSSQAVKVKLLDQKLVVGVGNIYASESLFRAGISPRVMSRRLTGVQVMRLHHAIREVLSEAIAVGSTIPLDFTGTARRDGLFYYGSSGDGGYEERLLVYDREGAPCVACGTGIQRITQAARSTYFCPVCQKSNKKH